MPDHKIHHGGHRGRGGISGESFFVILAIAIVLGFGARQSVRGAAQNAALAIRATRLPQNPLITVKSSSTLGDNVNGPAIIRVPSWIEHPLGRYYMYFAHHMGTHIRLAYADAITGPWHVYEPGVLRVENSAFFRPQPDPPENLENFYTHVASPEIYVDEPNRRLVMWFHGWWTDGSRWPVGEAAAREWARQRGYGQYTQSALSTDGVHFEVRPAISKTSYLRVFQHDGYFYGVARSGLLLRSRDPTASFETARSVFRNGEYANRVRHVALLPIASTLYVFFTAIGDAPERVMMSTVDISGDWQSWAASTPIELLRPQAPYECTTLPNEPSDAGDIKGPAQQLRDPALFQENGKTYLFYSICGEQGIAVAEVSGL